MKKLISFAILSLSISFLFIACNKNKDTPQEPVKATPPVITSISPAAGDTGTIITIEGKNFGTDKADMEAVLSNVTGFYIRGEFETGPDKGGMDNIEIIQTGA